MSQIPKFSLFSKYDPNNKLFVSDNIVDVIGGIGGATRLVYQLPATITDFSYDFLFNKTSAVLNTGTFIFAVSNQDSQWVGATWNGVGVYFDGGQFAAAQAINGVGGFLASVGIAVAAGTDYYGTVSRVADVLTVSIYTDAARTVHAAGSPVTLTPCLTTAFGFLNIQNMLDTHTGARTNSLSRNDSFASTLWTAPADKGIQTANAGRYYGNGLIIIQLGGGAANGKVIRSTDNGVTWGSIIYTGIATANIIPASDSSGIILIGCGSDGLIARSLDNGLSWTTVATGNVENGLANMGNGKYISAGGAPIVVISNDYGLTWGVPIGTGGVQNSMPVYMGNGIVVVGEVVNGNIERSVDYGQTWNTIATPAARNFYLLNADGVLLYGDYAGNVTRSTDNGVTWGALIPTGLPTNPITLYYLGNGVIYAGDTGSKFLSKSTDFGNTWILERTQLNDTSVIISAENKLMVVSYANGYISYYVEPLVEAHHIGFMKKRSVFNITDIDAHLIGFKKKRLFA